jgi:hypothetical protein
VLAGQRSRVIFDAFYLSIGGDASDGAIRPLKNELFGESEEGQHCVDVEAMKFPLGGVRIEGGECPAVGRKVPDRGADLFRGCRAGAP